MKPTLQNRHNNVHIFTYSRGKRQYSAQRHILNLKMKQNHEKWYKAHERKPAHSPEVTIQIKQNHHKCILDYQRNQKWVPKQIASVKLVQSKPPGPKSKTVLLIKWRTILKAKTQPHPQFWVERDIIRSRLQGKCHEAAKDRATRPDRDNTRRRKGKEGKGTLVEEACQDTVWQYCDVVLPWHFHGNITSLLCYTTMLRKAERSN
jgi:hypothetical protein